MTTKELYDQVLKSKPEVINRWAAVDVMGFKKPEENYTGNSFVWLNADGGETNYCEWHEGWACEENEWRDWQPHNDDNQIRVLENKIKGNNNFWKYYDQIITLVIFDFNKTLICPCSDASNLTASDKLYCILLTVLGEDDLRKRLEEVEV